MNKTVVIIGAGMGGLFTGAFLAKEDYKVVVIEKNSTIGGGLQTFMRHGVSFDTGLHTLGGFRDGGSLQKICHYFGILKDLDILDVDDDCMDSITYLEDGKTYKIRSGREGFTESFVSFFPEEEDGIRQYVDALYRMSNGVNLFWLRPSGDDVSIKDGMFFWPANKMIEHYVRDERLRDMLAYMNPMYAGVKGHTPAYIHSLINVLYINGPSRLAGGSRQLATGLASVIKASGGEIITGQAVTGVNVSNRQVQSVVTEKGTEYTADYYISDIHPCSLLNILPVHAFPHSFCDRLRSIPSTYSAFSVFVIFKKNTFPYINHTCYFQEKYGQVWSHSLYDDMWPRGFMYITPPCRGQGHYAVSMIINSLMEYKQVIPWETTTTGKRGKDYEEWKKSRMEQVIGRIEQLYPDFRNCIDSVFAASPLTIRDYYNTKEGALYGFRKDCNNMALSHLSVFTKISNLLLTGQNINLHGICGVPLTAINTAEAIVGKDTIVHKINNSYVKDHDIIQSI